MADDGALRSAEARLKAIDKEAKNLVDALCASGASAPAFVMARLNELETERSNVQAMVLFEQSMREQVMDAGSIQTFYERYNGVDPHEALVRDELMRYFVRDVLVYDDKVVIRGKWKDGDDYTIGVDNHFWEEYPEEAAAGTITVSGRLFRASRLPDSSSQARLSTGLNSRHEQRYEIGIVVTVAYVLGTKCGMRLRFGTDRWGNIARAIMRNGLFDTSRCVG